MTPTTTPTAQDVIDMIGKGYTLRIFPDGAMALMPHPKIAGQQFQPIGQSFSTLYQQAKAARNPLRQMTPNQITDRVLQKDPRNGKEIWGSVTWGGYLDLGFPADGSKYFKLTH